MIDQCGFDARDAYVETYWLPILGPSAVLAARRIADWLDRQPAGVGIDLVEFGASLGIGIGTGRNTRSTVPSAASSTSAWPVSPATTWRSTRPRLRCRCGSGVGSRCHCSTRSPITNGAVSTGNERAGGDRSGKPPPPAPTPCLPLPLSSLTTPDHHRVGHP